MAVVCLKNEQPAPSSDEHSFSNKRKNILLRTVLCAPLLFSLVGCLVSRNESSELILKGSSAESAEVVNLDPVFLSRQSQVESQFFGFDSSVVTNHGRVPLSSDEDDHDVDVVAPAETGSLSETTESLLRRLSLAWPLKGAISSPFGMRRGRLHAGVDISAPRGTPIYASADGQILTAKRRGAYGNVVIVGHDNDHQTLYAHMLRNIAREGSYVQAGELLGYVGRTGRATGYHLHFETRVAGGIPQDPLRFLPGGRLVKVGAKVPFQASKFKGM